MASVKSNSAKPNLTRANKFELAIEPAENIAVFASAGSGKTHLLVHRILKLLLNDVEASQILAITFTRKAAAEMQERLMKILAEWASQDDTQVKNALQSISHPHDEASIAKARKLYEELLFAEYEIRITTFHAFCQDILKRFALHAGVPAGFSVTESNHEFKQEARKRLFKLAKHEKHQNLSKALYTLLKHCNTVYNVNEILDAFIESRSDWRSYTEHQSSPVEYADECLRKTLFPNSSSTKTKLEPLAPLLQEYATYLAAHNTKTNRGYCELLAAYLEIKQPDEHNIDSILSVFFKTDMDKREIKNTKTLEKALGDKTQTFITLHNTIGEYLDDYLDVIRKENLIEFNRAWFYAGHMLLKEYQDLKFNQHTLDFDDLEWYTYLLLNQNDSAAWIQYKLDQRIQHVLIDEFQDTNPTQWHLILPLLNELAIDSHENHRSLFLVGDSKQSIYGFRRANPKLQYTAADWAKENLNAKLLEADDSYRSSPAVIEFVNKIFSQSGIELKSFNPHQAVQSDLWGKVQVSQLCRPTETSDQDSEDKEKKFRNPLLEARQISSKDAHYIEGQLVAKNIQALIQNATPILENQTPRPVEYRDIIILARNRTHLYQLELALSEEKIPFNSTYDEEFLKQLETQDIISLLTYLTQTHNDLALAQVLRSPLYGMNDQDLMEISCQKGNTWHEKLNSYADSSDNVIAKQAFEQLQHWRSIANTLPVHDLLDRIYFETGILKRYANNLSGQENNEKKASVLENLTALLQLSLDLDAGRYSSIQSFLNALQNMQPNDTASYAQSHTNENAVNIMTIHSAKGLEAPVVFLVDTGPRKNPIDTYKPIIDWPSQARRPLQFFLTARKNNIDKVSRKIIDRQTESRNKEELNLLYVALTRSKQYLFISGSDSSRTSKKSWHDIISGALSEDFESQKSETWVSEFGTAPVVKPKIITSVTTNTYSDFDLSKPFPISEQSSHEPANNDAKEKDLADYGTIVHKIFELVGERRELLQTRDSLKLAAESSLNISIKQNDFNSAVNEVANCLQSPELKSLFNNTDKQEILREAPISFIKNNIAFYRIIDHLIISDNEAWIIDYKTSSEVTPDNMQEAANQHLPQINTYAEAVKKLYPDKNIRASILFTTIPALYDFDLKI